MAGNTASLTFKLFGVDVTARKTISGVGVAAAGTAKQLETLAAGTSKFIAGAGAAGVASVGLAGAIGVGLGGAFAAVGVKAALLNKDVKKHFKDLGTTLKNQIAADAAPVAATMNNLAKYIGATLKTMQPVLKGLFRDIAPLVDVFGKGLVGAVANLVTEFRPLISQVLPLIRTVFAQLPDLIGNLAAALHMILDPLTGNTKAFAQLIQIVSGLLPILGSILGNFVRLGASIMPVFQRALLGVGAALDSGLGKVLPLVGKAINQILPPLSQLISVALRSLGQILAAVIPVLGRLISSLAAGLAKVLPSLVPAFITLVDAVNQLLPALVPLIPPIAVLLKGTSNLIPPLATLAATLIVALSPALNLIVRGVSLLASWLGAQLTRAVQFVQPYLLAAATFLSKNLGPAVATVGRWITGTLVPALIAIGRWIGTRVLPPVIAAGKAFIQALWPALKTAWNAIQTQLIPAIGKLWPLVKFLAQVVGVVLYVALTKVIPILLRIAGPILGFLISTLAKVIGWIGNLIGWLGRAVTWLGRAGATIISAFNKANQWLFQAGRRIVTGLWDGIKNMWNSVVGWFEGLPSKILGALGIHSPPDWAISAGRHIMGGILKGIAHGTSDVRGFFRGLASDITGPLAHIWAGLFSGPAIGPTSYGKNRQLVQSLAEKLYGWVGAQWIALANLISGESGFNNRAQNPTSSAFGLFQFLDSTWSAVGVPKTADPYAQTIAGLRYIAGRYGSPAAAYGAWLGRTPHWYASGMPPTVFTRPTLIGVGEAGEETVSVARGRAQVGASGTYHFHFHGMVGSKTEIVAWVRQGMREARRAEGRDASTV